MNDPRFEVFPEHHAVGHANLELAGKPTGEFGWRFRAANGQISATAGESFTRREDARRAVEEFVVSAIGATAGSSPPNAGAPLQIAIHNVDEDGRIVEDETPPEPEPGTEAEYAEDGGDAGESG